MIYIHPVGGLGNMFFHIASIWSLAKDHDDELCLLNINKKINDLINDSRCDLKHAADYKYIFDRFKCIEGNVNQSIEYPFKYCLLEYKNEHEYRGYFQCEEYFKHRRIEILNLFKPAIENLEEINKYSDLFGNISLHVRRGDYVKMYPEIHIPQTIEYYNNALSLLPNDMKVLIFSDDIKWCRENFIGERYVFIDEIDYISIYLMSKMNHHIIANSSFSWWGAWLSEYENKIIIAPKNWFGSRKINLDADLIPKNWIRI
jgi:hypothetical protein